MISIGVSDLRKIGIWTVAEGVATRRLVGGTGKLAVTVTTAVPPPLLGRARTVPSASTDTRFGVEVLHLR
ncbi:hypothetical protein D3C87_1834400 [compost metagenome]